MKYQNIYQLFKEQTAKYRGKPVFYSRENENWVAENWESFDEKVHDFACALLAKGLTKGASVAILAGNIKEWAIADIGTIAAGGVGVGIYPTSSPEQCEYIINDSDAEFVFVDTQGQLEKLAKINCPKFKEIICLEKLSDGFAVLMCGKAEPFRSKFQTKVEAQPQPVLDIESAESPRLSAHQVAKPPKIINFEKFLEFGKQNRDEFLPKLEEITNSLNLSDTAIMVYTSGTTGEPKGAMLSHQYILNSCESLKQTIPIFADDVCFSYLPHCHVAERISGLYNRLYNGTSVYFVDDLMRLYEYMFEVRPTVFASLPRFFEKIYAKVVSEHGKDPEPKTVKDAFGGRIRLLTSGGAALPDEVADFFAKAKVPILQAYGLTENICVAFNRADDFKFGTVGKPMPMCEVKIADDGEILIKSPMMFSGYYKKPEKTAKMFDENGWLRTGDLGSLDADGFLKITGRKKEIIVLSSGKNVAPALVENLVKENHIVSQCFLSGDGRNYCVALITLNQAEAEMFAKANNIEFENFVDLARNEQIYDSIAETVEKANLKVSRTEQIKKFVILERDFSMEAGEITPTMKIKRNVVTENFAEEIDNLYKNLLRANTN